MKFKIILSILVVFIIFLVSCTQQTNIEVECNKDIDCQYVFNSCPNGPELCAPRWGAFCLEGKCGLSHNIDASETDQWLDTCKEHKKRGLQEWVIRKCYTNAAFSSLKKSANLGNYTIIFSDSLKICEDYLSFDSSAECKKSVCDNLHIGDGNIKYNYPESKDCYLMIESKEQIK